MFIAGVFALFLAAHNEGIQNTSYYAKVIKNPTGQNGYEEYMQAVDLTLHEDYRRSLNWIGRTPKDRAEQQLEPPSGITARDSDLAARRHFVHEFSKCLALVEEGNQKPVFDPRGKINVETTFPEYASFKSIAKFGIAAAEVSFADGQTGEGIKRLADIIVFSRKFSPFVLITRLVGIACESIALRDLDRRWGQLSLSDAQQLEQLFAQLLSTPSPLIDAYRNEAKFATATIEDVMTHPNKFSSGTESGSKGSDSDSKDADIIGAAAKASPAELAQLIKEVGSGLEKAYGKAIEVLTGPEKQILAWQEDDVIPKVGTPTALALESLMLPVLGQSMIVEESTRTWERMEYLKAKVVEYRWLNGRFPEKIEDFATKAERLDPTTGDDFVYSTDTTTFVVRRNGNDAIGDRLNRKPRPQIQPTDQP